MSAFDNRYYRKAACVRKVGFRTPYHLDEFKYVSKHAKKQVKVPITGPYTLAEWSFNEFYQKKLMRENADLKSIKQDSKRELVLDIARIAPTEHWCAHSCRCSLDSDR